MLEVYIDGACEPVNPGGTASYGVVVYEGKARLWAKSAVVGKGSRMSNNVAEYSGLIALLEWYLDNAKSLSTIAIVDYEDATIRSDSQMLINQMSNRWQVRQGLYVPYYLQVAKLVNQHGLGICLHYQWIPREQNWEVDKLSKDALRAHGVRIRGEE